MNNSTPIYFKNLYNMGSNFKPSSFHSVFSETQYANIINKKSVLGFIWLFILKTLDFITSLSWISAIKLDGELKRKYLKKAHWRARRRRKKGARGREARECWRRSDAHLQKPLGICRSHWRLQLFTPHFTSHTRFDNFCSLIFFNSTDPTAKN